MSASRPDTQQKNEPYLEAQTKVAKWDSGFAPIAPTLSSKELGRQGEQAAARFLAQTGYEILERNWECFAGEADIIAKEGDVLCFTEVKTRRGVGKGLPVEAVSAKKRDKYEKIALCYLRDHGIYDCPVRFDIISVLVVAPHQVKICLYADAFGGRR